MGTSLLEHVNITVTDPAKSAATLCELFGWQVRWEGESQMGGHTYHVGSEQQYIAVYSTGDPKRSQQESYSILGGLNHVGVVVTDLDAVEKRVKALGFEPHSHGDYDPGKRFYFDDADGIEWEVVSYVN